MTDGQETIVSLVYSCITFSGRDEDDLLAEYARRCLSKKITPLYGQVKSALKVLYKQGKIHVITVQGRKLCCKTRES